MASQPTLRLGAFICIQHGVCLGFGILFFSSVARGRAMEGTISFFSPIITSFFWSSTAHKNGRPVTATTTLSRLF
jgi:hypothetical protein